MATHSLWFGRMGEPTLRQALAGDLEVDVAIVGAGFTGLWTAYYLASLDPALRIVVLEARYAGFGASGRNGGWVSAKLAGLDGMMADPQRRSEALALQHAMFDAVDEVGRVAAAEGIDCGYVKGGTIVVATRPPHVDRLQAGIALRRSVGIGGEHYRWLEPAEAAERIRPSVNLGAVYTPHCAVVDPAVLVRGLADVVERRGVAVYEGTPAGRIEHGRVHTPHGTVKAATVVRATEAYTVKLPGLRRVVTPVYSLMIATEPLGDGAWREIGLAGRETFSDGRRLIIYGQRTDDGRIAFGGRGAPYHFGSGIEDHYDHDRKTFDKLRLTLGELFPVLRDVEVEYEWGGPLGVPRDWLPTVDHHDGVAWAGGYAGQGVSTTNLAGRILADLITGRPSDLTRLAIVRKRSPRWEPEPLRWLGVNTGLALTEWVDASERRSGKPARWRGKVLKRLIGM